jgi:hypothetical protein
MITSRIRFFRLGALALGSALLVASAAQAGEIVMALEEPIAGSAYSGVSNLRGWAVGSAGIDRVELYVDGTFATNVPVGGLRGDVGDRYPSFPDSRNSGFSMAFNYSNLSAGPHAVRVRAVDPQGASQEATVNFNVTRFDNPYIADPAKINLSGASGSFDARSISLKNVSADGKIYDVRLDWRTEAQGFVITQITSSDDPPAGNFGGTYRLATSLTGKTCAFDAPPQVQDELKLTQNSSQLSGKLVDGTPLSGTVNEQGAFALQSDRKKLELNANCRAEFLIRLQGGFPGQTVTVDLPYEFFGSCPYINCTLNYQGTITKTSNTTRAEAPASAPSQTPAGAVESLLEAGKPF